MSDDIAFDTVQDDDLADEALDRTEGAKVLCGLCNYRPVPCKA